MKSVSTVSTANLIALLAIAAAPMIVGLVLLYVQNAGHGGPAGVCVESYSFPDSPSAKQIVTGVTTPVRDASGVLVCNTGTFVPVDEP